MGEHRRKLPVAFRAVACYIRRMTHVELADVRSIAREARRWAERLAGTHEFGEDLGGLCAVASGHLHKKLRDAGYKSVLATNDNHCFVLLNGYVVDITATQFVRTRNISVLVAKLTRMRAEGTYSRPWLITKTTTSRREMRKFQIEEGWPAEQVVATPTIKGA